MDIIDEVLKVIPSGDLMKSYISSMKLSLDDAKAQFEQGKNEGAAYAVGQARFALDQMNDIFEKVYTK